MPGFYLRRSLRIFPVYYGLLAVLAVAFTIKPGGKNGAPFFHDLPYLLTYTTNWIPAASLMGIAWSLAVEEQFYLVWPPIEKWLARWAWAILLAFLAVNQAANFLLASGVLARWFGPENTPWMAEVTFTPICLGVALAHVLHSPRGFRILRVGSRRRAPVAVLAAFYVDCWAAPPHIAGWPRLSMQVLMAILLASCVVRERHWLSPVLDTAVMRRIGVVSYGIYLYHLLGMHAANMVLGRSHVAFPHDRFWLTFFITWGMAEVSYRFYETPFLKLKERLGRRHSSAADLDGQPSDDEPIAGNAPAGRPPIGAGPEDVSDDLIVAGATARAAQSELPLPAGTAPIDS